ncbi:Alpha/Beta hydrolase protein [Mycena pura]|uniref:Alpha/Beta hydrolase protein n=1 Tax=Mycena pura TaxID=153505 RepID=A0AAD6UPZ8_9AGAR|nr:Alpha/Beta hydrolase protein [Mycena pura]
MTSDAYTEAWLTGPQSTKFYTRTYLAPTDTSKAVLVFVHGFAEHVGRYTQAHPVLAARGVNVFAFDERGFGKTALDEANKSKTSAYGKTSAADQMVDIAWALGHAAGAFPGLPLFLMGHSMGGGEVLSFSSRRPEDASKLAGVISSSPLVHQTKPASKAARWAGGIAGVLFPYMPIPAAVDYNALSHDPDYNKLCSKDPLAKLQGTLRGVGDMLNWGEMLLISQYHKWPKSLPVLFLHGSGDEVASHSATQKFHDKIVCDNKKIIIYPGGFHELVHEPSHREKLFDDIMTFIEEHIPAKETNPVAESSGPAESKL